MEIAFPYVTKFVGTKNYVIQKAASSLYWSMLEIYKRLK